MLEMATNKCCIATQPREDLTLRRSNDTWRDMENWIGPQNLQDQRRLSAHAIVGWLIRRNYALQ